MVILAVKINLYLKFANNIKEKRNLNRQIIERIKSRFKVNAAELKSSLLKNSEIGIVICNDEKNFLEKILAKLYEFLNNYYFEYINYIEYNYFYF
ncbi:MAG TPA: DUF503 family protein [bacterium]|nr:DUF503 family protein [bacterium]HOL46665.1 DUF503 family protein [bacterium]HPQ18353.1 DUF503 family protein [bacterium]